MVLGGLLVIAGLIYGGLIAYLNWRESASPSTGIVLTLRDGSQLPLVQPTPPQVPTRPPAQIPAGAGNSGGILPAPQVVTTPTIQDTQQVFLPPLSVEIAAIGVKWPVVLGTNDNMPKFKGVGWLLGSGYPGVPGNMVLFGHLDGPNATFGSLRELRAGDLISISTEARTFSYRVNNSFQTTPDDVGVLAPTSGATATLITCSGRWDPIARAYDHRLIVTADLVAK
jgi:sortase A